MTNHQYQLTGIVNNQPIVSVVCPTRQAAELVMCSIIDKNGLQVQTEEYADKHVDEIKCDEYNRFRIARV